MVIKPIVEWRSPLFKYVFLGLFLPLSGVYGLAALVRRMAFRRFVRPCRVRVPVIGVGSLSVGGSGKTPVVQFLAEELVRRGIRPGVVSSGYGKTSPGVTVVSDGQRLLADVRESGDEAYMMASEFLEKGMAVPVVAGSDRAAASEELVHRFDIQTMLLDDGFQYLRLRQDHVVIVQDFVELGYAQVPLPVGRLREFPSARSHADVVLTTKVPESHEAGPGSSGLRYVPLWIERATDRLTYDVEVLRGKTVFAFAGLGHHAAFLRQLEHLCAEHGARLGGYSEFQDHHWYRASDVEPVCAKLKKTAPGSSIVLTTPKDAVKISTEWLHPFTDSLYLIRSAIRPIGPTVWLDELIARSLAAGRTAHH